MSVDVPVLPSPAPTATRAVKLALVLFVVVVAGALLWAKWQPYTIKVGKVIDTDSYPSGPILAKAGEAGSAPSLAGAWDFTLAYFTDVWKGFVAALLVGAAVDALLPRAWLLRASGGRSRLRGSLAGGAAGLPSFMCTCCAAPVAVSARRDGVQASATLAYLLGSPLLNPAVIAFLLILAPWQWAAVRVGVGIVVVFGLTALVARLDRDPPTVKAAEDIAPPELEGILRRYVRRLASLTLTLAPVYVLFVFLLGLFRGWVFPLDGLTSGVVAVGVAIVLGTLVDLPTAGEVPLVLALVGAGLGAGAAGALLITLPGISLVTMAMIFRSHRARLTAGATGAVAGGGLLAAGALAALS